MLKTRKIRKKQGKLHKKFCTGGGGNGELKVAMFIVGRIRGYQHVKDSLSRIMDKYKPTVFCSLNKKHKSDYIKEFCEFMKIDDERLNLEPAPPVPEWFYTVQPRYALHNAPTGRLEPIHVGYNSLLYHNKRVFSLLDKYQSTHDTKFDCILFFMPDLVCPDELVLKKPLANTIYFPTYEGNPHITHGLSYAIFYGNYEVMKYAMNMLDSLKELTEKDGIPFGLGEATFKKYIENANYTVEWFTYTYNFHESRQIRNERYNNIE